MAMRLDAQFLSMDRRRARVGYGSGLLAICLLASFGLVLAGLHFLAMRHSEVPAYLSHFRLLPHAWLWFAGLALFAAGAMCLAIALTAALPPGGWSVASLTFLYAVGPLAMLLAIFPAAAPGTQTDLAGRIHEGAAIAMFLALGFAMLCLFPALRWWSNPMAWTSLGLGLAFFMVTPWMVRGFVEGSPDVAYSERIVVLLQGAWLMTMGVWSRLETAPFAATRTHTPQEQPRSTAAPARD